MTPVGKKTNHRENLEAERWFCGNEVLLQLLVIIISRALLSPLIVIYYY